MLNEINWKWKMKEYANKLLEDFYAIANQLNSIKNKPITITGLPSITTSSLHLIETIGNNPEKKLSEIAELIGVTKGAVSQQVLKLEKKNILTRVRAEDNKKDCYLKLSPLGVKLNNFHKGIHDKLYLEFESMLSQMNERYIKMIHEFLVSASQYISEYQKEYFKEE